MTVTPLTNIVRIYAIAPLLLGKLYSLLDHFENVCIPDIQPALPGPLLHWIAPIPDREGLVVRPPVLRTASGKVAYHLLPLNVQLVNSFLGCVEEVHVENLGIQGKDGDARLDYQIYAQHDLELCASSRLPHFGGGHEEKERRKDNVQHIEWSLVKHVARKSDRNAQSVANRLYISGFISNSASSPDKIRR